MRLIITGNAPHEDDKWTMMDFGVVRKVQAAVFASFAGDMEDSIPLREEREVRVYLASSDQSEIAKRLNQGTTFCRIIFQVAIWVKSHASKCFVS